MIQNQATIIAYCQNVELYKLLNGKRDRVSFGKISLATIQQEIWFIQLSELFQNIIGLTMVIQKNQNCLNLLFPDYQEGIHLLCFNINEESNNFIEELQKKCIFVEINIALVNEQFRQILNKHCNDIEINPIQNKGSAVHYIQKTGQQLNQGLVQIGQVVGQGIQQGAELAESKVQKDSPVQISKSTNQTLQNMKFQMDISVSVMKSLLDQVIKPISNTANKCSNELNHKIEISDNGVLKDAKNITVATWNAAAQTMDGLGEVASQIGKNLYTGTKQIINKKYGDVVVKNE